MLEYAIGFIAVACAWSNYFVQFMAGFDKVLPAWLAHPPAWLTNDVFAAGKIVAETLILYSEILGVPICINVPAIAIVLLITAILVKGTKDSAKWQELWYLSNWQ